MLELNNVTKIFKTDIMAQPFTALSQVSFTIPTGSMVGFLGANGAGKTTSLKIIMDFIRADQGEIIFSEDLGQTKIDVFKNLGFLPERPYFYPNLTGNEFLHFMGSLSEMKRKSITQAINKWAERFKIDYALNRPLRTYSKGMLQRIGFMATILHEPKFIILDEPLSGLDPIGRKELKDVIVEVHREGKTVFFSSHIVSDIEEICDRVIFLKEGKLVYDGSVQELMMSGDKGEYLVKFKTNASINISTPFLSKEDYPGGISSLKVAAKNKEVLVKELISKEIELLGLESVKPSLEEIFYQRKG